jgi:hypothetical protein
VIINLLNLCTCTHRCKAYGHAGMQSVVNYQAYYKESRAEYSSKLIFVKACSHGPQCSPPPKGECAIWIKTFQALTLQLLQILLSLAS